MSTLSLRLPDSIHTKIKELARREGVSVNQFLNSAAAEKVSAILTVDYLKREAASGSREDFLKVLEKVPDVPPQPEDELKPPARKPARRSGKRP